MDKSIQDLPPSSPGDVSERGLARVLLIACLALPLGGALEGCYSQSFELAREHGVAARTQPVPETDYMLHRGDDVTIKFFYNKDLNEQLRIRPDGKISLQLVGDMRAAGLTTGELSEKLADRYGEVLKHPEVAVIVNSFTTERVYVGGEVNLPGIIDRTPSLTALQAIFQAAGFKDTAEPRNVVIVRDQGTETPLFLVLDLKRGLNSFETSEDVQLRPHDIVFVPKSTISTINKFVDQYINKLIPASTTFNVSYIFGKGAVFE